MNRLLYKLASAVVFRLHTFKQIETRVVFGFLSPKEGETICDIGCGSGQFSVRIAKAGATVYGIDLSESTVQKARRVGERHDCRFSWDNAESLSFASGMFDKVVSVCVLEHIANDEDALREMYRVLKPGGILVLSVDTLDYRGIGESFRSFHRKSARVVNYYTYRELAPRLQTLGFRVEGKRYIINSPLSSLFFKLGKKLRWGLPYLAMFPVIYALSVISDNLLGYEDEGYQLVIKASKPA